MFKKIANIFTSSMNGTINVNGVSYTGNSISIDGDTIIIDGKNVTSTTDKVISISITGDLGDIKATCKEISVTGNSKTIETGSGNVKVGGSVSGSVGTGSGKVDVQGDVGGDIDTGSGNVMCMQVKGTVDTGSGKVTSYK